MVQLHFEQTAIGRIGIAAENGSITHLCFPTDAPPADAELCATPLLKEAFSQLHAWLAGEANGIFAAARTKRHRLHASCLAGALPDSLRQHSELQGDCRCVRQPQRRPGSRDGLQQKPAADFHTLPPGNRCKRQADRLRRRTGIERKAAGA